jgi:hypothetical protein
MDAGKNVLSRRHFCLCCAGGATFAATGGWLTPHQAYAEARGLVSLIKDSAATSPIVTRKLRDSIAVLSTCVHGFGRYSRPHHFPMDCNSAPLRRSSSGRGCALPSSIRAGRTSYRHCSWA